MGDTKRPYGPELMALVDHVVDATPPFGRVGARARLDGFIEGYVEASERLGDAAPDTLRTSVEIEAAKAITRLCEAEIATR